MDLSIFVNKINKVVLFLKIYANRLSMEMVNQRKNKERTKIEHIANKSKSVELRHSFSKRLLNNPPNQKKGKKATSKSEQK